MINIEKFVDTDFNQLKLWIKNEEELVQFAGPIFTFPLTDEQLYKYIDDPNVNAFKVVDRENNLTIGHAEIYTKDDKIPKLCRIIVGDKKYRGKGIGQQIVKQLLNISFNQFNAEKVELNVFDWNISAIKCYEKVGFTINPNKQKEVSVNGKKWISINMAIEADW